MILFVYLITYKSFPIYKYIYIYTHTRFDRCLFFSEKENRGNKFAITIFSRRLSKPDNNSSDRYRFDQQFPRYRKKKNDRRENAFAGWRPIRGRAAKHPASNQKARRLSAGQRVFSLHSAGEARFAAAKSTRVAVMVRLECDDEHGRRPATFPREGQFSQCRVSFYIPSSTFFPCSLLLSRT